MTSSAPRPARSVTAAAIGADSAAVGGVGIASRLANSSIANDLSQIEDGCLGSENWP